MTPDMERHVMLFSDSAVFGRSVVLRTQFPLAFDSPDHLSPQGVVEDFTDGTAFGMQYAARFPSARKALDLGCATGMVPLGYRWAGLESYGLEGSDAAREKGFGAWGWFPGIVETCDISRPFELVDGRGERVLFDLVTAWGVLEHIHPDRLGQCLNNMVAHLAPGGYAVLAVDLGGNPWYQAHNGGDKPGRILYMREHWLPLLAEYGEVDDAVRTERAWIYARPQFNERLCIPRAEFAGKPAFQGELRADVAGRIDGGLTEGRFYAWLRRRG